MLQSTFSSKLLSLGQITASTSPPGTTKPAGDQSAASSAVVPPGLGFHYFSLSLSLVPKHVNARSLSSLYGFLRERRPLLVSLPPRPPQDLNRLPYAALRSLKVNTLVHALLRVTHAHISPGESMTYSVGVVMSLGTCPVHLCHRKTEMIVCVCVCQRGGVRRSLAAGRGFS